MTDWALQVKNISKSFGGIKALNHINLEIKEGEIVCLVGENGSGKSTMIKIISGMYVPDEGELIIDQHHYKKISPIESIHKGIQVIYQDFSLFPNLSVAENLAISEQISSGKKIVSWKEYKRIAAKGIADINASLELDKKVSELSTADRQLVAIIKAIMAEARLIIMDEPTTALTQKEIKSLFKMIQHLKERNIAILFVSHKLTEIKEIADRTIIFRNGEKVLDQDAHKLDIENMEYYMTGRKLQNIGSKGKKVGNDLEPILEIEDLGVKDKFSNISFNLKSGEILGITGLLGSGRRALALALFGVNPADKGKIKIKGDETKIKNIQDAIKLKISYVPEDRHTEGLFLDQTIEDNIVVSTINNLTNWLSLIREESKNKLADSWVQQLNIKTPSSKLDVKTLSGGNQQRVVLAKWLANKPEILILNGPTVGVDVGSKADIHKLIQALASEGIGILLISDDIPELIRNCDKILLMKDGRITNSFIRGEVNTEQLNEAMIAQSIDMEII